MKRFDFNKDDYNKVTVICKNDGPIAYCNALAVDGTCKCNDCHCKQAIAVVASKQIEYQVRDYRTGEIRVATSEQTYYLALED